MVEFWKTALSLMAFLMLLEMWTVFSVAPGADGPRCRRSKTGILGVDRIIVYSSGLRSDGEFRMKLLLSYVGVTFERARSLLSALGNVRDGEFTMILSDDLDIDASFVRRASVELFANRRVPFVWLTSCASNVTRSCCSCDRAFAVRGSSAAKSFTPNADPWLVLPIIPPLATVISDPRTARVPNSAVRELSDVLWLTSN